GRRVRIPLGDTASAIAQGGDAVLCVAVVVTRATAAAAQHHLVDVAGVDIGVAGAARGRAGRVIGQRLLAILEVDDTGRAIVTADPAAEGVPAVEDIVDTIIIGVGGA